jgi:hypothetical protein
MTDPTDFDLEASEADAAEQRTGTEPPEDDASPSADLEAPEWDALEQSRTVQLEDDYR